jgi:hypothetical protein
MVMMKMPEDDSIMLRIELLYSIVIRSNNQGTT